jgi:Zn-dependent alcohol dehydrogenase
MKKLLTIVTLLFAFLSIHLYADDAKPDPMKVVASWTSITTEYGKVIPITKVTAVDAVAVHNISDTGCGAIPIADLPDDIQKALGYDPDAAAKAKADQVAHDAATDALVIRVTAQEQAAKQQASVIQPVSTIPTMSDSERASIQSEIAELRSDIAFMQAQDAKVDASGRLVTDHNKVSRGGYADKIAHEQAEIAQLQSSCR